MVRNKSHILQGIAAVIDSANVCKPSTVWVDTEDVGRALTQASKLSGDDFPDVEAYSGGSEKRVALRLR